MSTRRTARVAQAIRQVVSTAVLIELRDPRVKNVTVLHVEVPVDLRTAKVYVSIMGDEKMESLSLKGLEAARGWIQSRIADELDLRSTPVLTFIVDRGIKKSIEVSKLLRQHEPMAGEEYEDDDDDNNVDFDEVSDEPANDEPESPEGDKG
ncbi:30S ribosome-binding factor RbfA [Planctomicrobium sp. SH668]|uniref:30S ribosome-binding factor RbfA n=1 Tax=Planctomicrobium sp. SH668 TaxID=3448126 RepID=UPI003F5C26A0